MKSFTFDNVTYKQVARLYDSVVGVQLLDSCCAKVITISSTGATNVLKGSIEYVQNKLASLTAHIAVSEASTYEVKPEVQDLKIADGTLIPALKPLTVPGTQTTYNTLIITDAGILSYSHAFLHDASNEPAKQPRIRVAKKDQNASWPNLFVGPGVTWQTAEPTHTAMTAHAFADTLTLIAHGVLNLWKLGKVFE